MKYIYKLQLEFFTNFSSEVREQSGFQIDHYCITIQGKTWSMYISCTSQAN